MKKLLIPAVISLFLIACGNSEKKEDQSSGKDAEMKSLYEQNLAAVMAGFAAFEKKDLDGFASHLDDKVVWNSAAYGDTVTTKTHWMEVLKFYSENWDNVKFDNANYLPGIDSATHEFDGSVRCYGTWVGTHKSGVVTHSPYYATFDLNKDHKITFAAEYFDAGGLMNAVMPKAKM